MRTLITGAGGFVGGHLAAHCRDAGATVFGLLRPGSADASGGVVEEHFTADMGDTEAIARALRSVEPDRVFHLAAESSVPRSWKEPGETFRVNLHGTINLLDAVRAHAPDARVLVASSAEVYGPVPEDELPVTEARPPSPRNPYAVSKAAAELVAGFYREAHGMHVTTTRAFNHIGPGQSIAFVVSSFARQLAEAEIAGRSEVVLTTGDLSPRRDFTDVRDAVRGHAQALEEAPPDVYNVCSGRSVRIADILARLAAQTPLEVGQRTDPELVRPHVNKESRGSYEKLAGATGWEPRIPLDQTLGDALDWWRAELAGAGA